MQNMFGIQNLTSEKFNNAAYVPQICFNRVYKTLAESNVTTTFLSIPEKE